MEFTCQLCEHYVPYYEKREDVFRKARWGRCGCGRSVNRLDINPACDRFQLPDNQGNTTCEQTQWDA